MGLGSCSIDRFLDFFRVGAGGFHGIKDEAFVAEHEHEVGFDFAAAAKTPHGSADFGCEILFEDTLWREFAAEGFVEIGVDLVFIGADEVGGGEETVFEGVFRGGGFSGVGAWPAVGVFNLW